MQNKAPDRMQPGKMLVLHNGFNAFDEKWSKIYGWGNGKNHSAKFCSINRGKILVMGDARMWLAGEKTVGISVAKISFLFHFPSDRTQLEEFQN
jgi:hypothetical protein